MTLIFGIAVGSAAGMSAAMFYVAHHITVQTTLFLVLGLVERRGGTTSLARLGGLAQVAPLLGVLFFLPAMNLAGIPPFSGFLGKVGLLQAGAQQGTVLAYTLIGGAVLTSLLTLYAVSRVWSRAFWRSPSPSVRQAPARLPAGMVGPTAALVAVGVGITVVAGPLYSVTDRAADEMLARTPYVSAVFRRVVRGPTVLTRIVALDVLVSILVTLLGLEAAYNRHTTTIPIAVALALVGFVGGVSAARFVAPEEQPDDQAGAPSTLGVDP